MNKALQERLQSEVDHFTAELASIIQEAVAEGIAEGLGMGARLALPSSSSTSSTTSTAAGRGRRKAAKKAPRRKAAKRRTKRGKTGEKRSAKEIERIQKAILREVKKHPGSRIEQIGAETGLSTAEMRLPMQKLIADKAIKTKGQRRAMKYSPR